MDYTSLHLAAGLLGTGMGKEAMEQGTEAKSACWRGYQLHISAVSPSAVFVWTGMIVFCLMIQRRAVVGCARRFCRLRI